MNGVEILNEYQVVADSTFGWTAFWITSGIVLGIFIIIGIILSILQEPDFTGWITLIFVGILVAAIAGAVLGETYSTPTKYETHYQVTIDDSVSMTDFLEKYEIIDTEGKILTVRQRDCGDCNE